MKHSIPPLKTPPKTKTIQIIDNEPKKTKIKTMFKFIKTLFLLSLLALVIGLSYTAYQNLTAAKYTPENTTKQFISILQNPTDTITPNEKTTLSNITQTNFLQSAQNEIIIINLRKLAKDKQIKILDLSTKDSTYTTTSIEISDNKSKLIIPIYLETTGDFWSGGVRSKIYKIDVPAQIQAPTFDALQTQIQDILDKARQTITDKINPTTIPKIEIPANPKF
jgi:hypothetical protein